MTIKLKSLRANTAAENEGEWVDVPQFAVKGEMVFFPEVAFKVRSSNYAPFLLSRNREAARLQRKHGINEVPAEEAAKVDGRLAVQHLLLDWKGFDVPYSEETAQEVLTDEGYRTVRDMVYWAALRVGKNEVEFLEEAAKNSEPSSATG